MNLIILPGKYSIYRFHNDSAVPVWINKSGFYSVTRTSDELSVVALQNELISGEVLCNRDWRIIKIEGPLDFSLVGIIAEIATIVSKKKIPIFTISTYDMDYVLVKENDLDKAVGAFEEDGYDVRYEV